MLREFIDRLENMPQKALANGLSASINKPLVSVICATNGFSVGSAGIDRVAGKVCEGIIAAGGTPKRFTLPATDTISAYGTDAAKYDLPSRDFTADAVELTCSAEFYDGIVFVVSQSNVAWGMLLGAIRMNLPCMFVSVGTMSPLLFENKQYGYDLLYKQIGLVKTGKTPYDKIHELEALYPLVPGTDCNSYDENSFHCLAESFGLAVKGNGTAPAGTFERDNIAFGTGNAIIELVKQRCTPRRLVTTASINNAIMLDLACGGSTTSLINLIALAKTLALKNVSIKTIGQIAESAKELAQKQNNTAFMQEFHKAGGVYAVLKNIYVAGKLKTDCQIDGERTIEQALADEREIDNTVITKWNDQAASTPIKVLYGNVAESGCIARIPAGMSAFCGKVKVYESEAFAVEAILHREISDGDVIVIRGEGPKSAPGMPKIFYSQALLEGMGITNVAVITDGNISDVYNGISVGCITPESGEQCLFSVLQDGDKIEIGKKGKITCEIKTKDVATRLRNMQSTIGNYSNAYLKRWSKLCATAIDGCIIK